MTYSPLVAAIWGRQLTIRTEDWYLALTAVSAVAPTTNEVFSERDMQVLVDTIDTEPDPIPMRWLNAFVGRIFFGLYRTEALEQVSRHEKTRCID